jgi:hypothetical protein
MTWPGRAGSRKAEAHVRAAPGGPTAAMKLSGYARLICHSAAARGAFAVACRWPIRGTRYPMQNSLPSGLATITPQSRVRMRKPRFPWRCALRHSPVEIDIREPVAGSAVVGSLLVADAARVAELVGHDVAQLRVVRPDQCRVDVHGAGSTRRQGRRTPAGKVGGRAPEIEPRTEMITCGLHGLTSRRASV